MGKRKANHTISGMNAASAQGQGAGYNEEFANENLTAAERQNNKKRKKEPVTKNPKRNIHLLGFFLMFIT
ncbi:small acid-soluble spore protein O [Bacillus pacificus]